MTKISQILRPLALLLCALLLAGSASRSDQQSLKVLTFNLGRNQTIADLTWVGDTLLSEKEHTPDFILTQEVIFNDRDRPDQENTAMMIADRLGHQTIGSPRASGREGVAVSSRYPITYSDVRQLADRGVEFKRVAVLIETAVPGVGRVRVVSAHLAFLPFEDETRRKQLVEILQWVRDRETEVNAEITFFGGDLNATPSTRELKVIHDSEITHPLSFRSHNGSEPTQRAFGWARRLDYIFVSSPESGRTSERLQFIRESLLWPEKLGEISDHLPVLHEYSIR